MQEKSYAQLMGEHPAHIILTIDTKEPMELGAFVGALTSLGTEFEHFVREGHPDLKDDAEFFIKEIRSGSTVIEMIPLMCVVAPFIAQADQIMIAEDFIRRWGARITHLINGEPGPGQETKSDFKVWADTIQLIARDPDATHTLAAATFEDGQREIRVAYKFDTKDARKAQAYIEERKRELDRQTSADYERVLMVFTRSDVNNAVIGKRSGEMVRIEQLGSKALALMYGSDLAEQQIKHEVREADDNVYKKGFVVNVNVQMRNGKPIAYSVTHVHQVVDLPDDE